MCVTKLTEKGHCERTFRPSLTTRNDAYVKVELNSSGLQRVLDSLSDQLTTVFVVKTVLQVQQLVLGRLVQLTKQGLVIILGGQLGVRISLSCFP